MARDKILIFLHMIDIKIAHITYFSEGLELQKYGHCFNCYIMFCFLCIVLLVLMELWIVSGGISHGEVRIQ